MAYSYRRDLTFREQLPAVGAGAAAGLGVAVVVWYAARILIARTPLLPGEDANAASLGRRGAAAQLAPPSRGRGA